jgi:hypothetical protein
MTHDEWKTWKQLSPLKFRQVHDLLTLREAKAKRREYLMEEVNYIVGSDSRAINDFQNMTNMYLRWMDTPQGHNHWADLNNRITSIR